MTPITTIIIDDEQRARNVLTSLLERSKVSVRILASCKNLEEGVKHIKALQPQLVFLDVQMPNYAGYEIARFFETINFDIIFITAYDNYAIKAFELNAMDYLVKPIDRKQLERALQRVQDKLQQQADLMDYKELLLLISQKKNKQIILPELGNRHIVLINDIVAIEADGAYSSIHLSDNRVITVSKNLKHFEQLLDEESSFFRSHRTWLINIKYASTLNKTEQTVSMHDGAFIAKISRVKIADFEARL